MKKASGKKKKNNRKSRISSSHKRAKLMAALSRTPTREYVTET